MQTLDEIPSKDQADKEIYILFTVFPLVYVLYFEEFLIHDSRGFMILKKI